MKKNIVPIAFTAMFGALCVIPCLSFPFYKTKGAAAENVPEKPALIKENSINGNFSEDFEKWFSYYLPFRRENITASAIVKSKVFSSGSEKVIVGKNGFLFYKDEVSVYCGAESMSDREIFSAAEYLKLLDEYSDSLGIRFLFAAAPDKADICEKMLPDRIARPDVSDLERLHEALSQNGVDFADISEAFGDGGEKYYLKTDTHWNNLGGFLAWRKIMDSLGIPHKTYEGVSYSLSGEITGDLSSMLYPCAPSAEPQYVIDASLDESIRFLRPRSIDGNSGKEYILDDLTGDSEKHDFLAETENPSAEAGYAVIRRDSFSRAMLPYFIDNFKKTYITRGMTVSENALEDADYFIFETAERNIKLISSEAPFIPAPERTFPKSLSEKSDGFSLETDESLGMPYIGGNISPKLLEENPKAEIIILLSDRYAFEAYPIGEYGFGAYIPTDDLQSGSYDIKISVGKYCSDNIGTIQI